MNNFEKKNGIGEIISTSSDKAIAALWKNNYLSFGSLVVAKNTNFEILYICTNVLHKTIDDSRIVKPLCMTEVEIENQYPHLESYIFYEVELTAISAISQKTNAGFFSQFLKECPKLHSWIEPFNILAINSINELRNLFELILSLNIAEQIKQNILAKMILNIFENSLIDSKIKKCILEDFFIQFQSLFKTNLSMLEKIYSEANLFL